MRNMASDMQPDAAAAVETGAVDPHSGEEKFRPLLEAAPEAMVIVDERGCVNLINFEAESLFGYNRTELLGQPVELLLPERLRDRHAGHRGKFLEFPATRPMGAGLELSGRRKDGSEFPIEVRLSPLRTAEGLLVTAAIRDISERRNADRLRASLQEKEALLRELHHRVKNNLQLVCSLLSLQAEHVRDPAALAQFDEMQHRVRLMAAIHEALYKTQDFFRLDVQSFLQEITSNLLRSYAAQPGAIEIRTDVDSVMMRIETALPCGLIVNELVSNALKYAFRGREQGEIRVELKPAGEHRFVLRVADNGVGLPADAGWNDPQTFGWQLVNALAEQLNGQFEVRGDGGAEFTLTFLETVR